MPKGLGSNPAQKGISYQLFFKNKKIFTNTITKNPTYGGNNFTVNWNLLCSLVENIFIDSLGLGRDSNPDPSATHIGLNSNFSKSKSTKNPWNFSKETLKKLFIKIPKHPQPSKKSQWTPKQSSKSSSKNWCHLPLNSWIMYWQTKLFGKFVWRIIFSGSCLSNKYLHFYGFDRNNFSMKLKLKFSFISVQMSWGIF